MKKALILLLLSMAAMQALAADRKTVAILGDSYSTFETYVQPDTNLVWYFSPARLDKTDVTEPTQTWWHRLVSDGGYKLGVNNSFSGSTISYRGYDGADYKDRSFITRARQLGDPDIIFIFGATNDTWAGVPIGDYAYSDWTDEQLYTFRPAMARLLSEVLTRHPNVEVYFILNDILSEAINESVRTICAHYSVPLIELSGIAKQAGHPNAEGMAQIAAQVAAFVNARAAQPAPAAPAAEVAP